MNIDDLREMSEEVEVADDIEGLARRMLRAAYRRRRAMFGVEEVVAPREDPVVRELGYDDQNDEQLWAAEQWLEDRGYIVAARVDRGRPALGFYTITPAGREFGEEA